jgi:8-oxo-dGTP pyrophosphatase MutT (NUDIX family)
MPHIHEKIDLTVEVFVVNKRRVLLRKHDKYKLWLSIGGHVELDEDPTEAAVREVKEEVGLDIELNDHLQDYKEHTDRYAELIPPRFLNRHRINDSHEHVCMVYFARSDSDSIINQEEELSDEVRWFTFEDLENPEITESVRFYAKCALKETADQ